MTQGISNAAQVLIAWHRAYKDPVWGLMVSPLDLVWMLRDIDPETYELLGEDAGDLAEAIYEAAEHQSLASIVRDLYADAARIKRELAF